jgi:hypothetical protein
MAIMCSADFIDWVDSLWASARANEDTRTKIHGAIKRTHAEPDGSDATTFADCI